MVNDNKKIYIGEVFAEKDIRDTINYIFDFLEDNINQLNIDASTFQGLTPSSFATNIQGNKADNSLQKGQAVIGTTQLDNSSIFLSTDDINIKTSLINDFENNINLSNILLYLKNYTTTKVENLKDIDLQQKVDKEPGKGLSANDFSNDYKDKIDTIQIGNEGDILYIPPDYDWSGILLIEFRVIVKPDDSKWMQFKNTMSSEWVDLLDVSEFAPDVNIDTLLPKAKLLTMLNKITESDILNNGINLLSRAQKEALAGAIQTVTVNGQQVPKSGTNLDLTSVVKDKYGSTTNKTITNTTSFKDDLLGEYIKTITGVPTINQITNYIELHFNNSYYLVLQSGQLFFKKGSITLVTYPEDTASIDLDGLSQQYKDFRPVLLAINGLSNLDFFFNNSRSFNIVLNKQRELGDVYNESNQDKRELYLSESEYEYIVNNNQPIYDKARCIIYEQL